ncbi:unnamed protein product, partial [Symbiodinium necroappetens]
MPEACRQIGRSTRTPPARYSTTMRSRRRPLAPNRRVQHRQRPVRWEVCRPTGRSTKIQAVARRFTTRRSSLGGGEVQASGISAAAPATLSPCPVSGDSDDDAWSLVSSVSSTPEAQEDMERITGDKLELEKEPCKDQAAEKQARLLAEQKHAAALEAERKLQSVLQAMEQLRADHQRVTEEKEEEARLRAEAEMMHAAVAKEMQKLQEDHSRLKANKDAEEK